MQDSWSYAKIPYVWKFIKKKKSCLQEFSKQKHLSKEYHYNSYFMETFEWSA